MDGGYDLNKWIVLSWQLHVSALPLKKPKQERIEDRKAKRREEELTNKQQTDEKTDLTAEEKLEEKRRLEEAQRAADLQSAKELFGGMERQL